MTIKEFKNGINSCLPFGVNVNLNLSNIIVLVASENSCRMKLDVCPNILCLLLKYRVWQGYQILTVLFDFKIMQQAPDQVVKSKINCFDVKHMK